MSEDVFLCPTSNFVSIDSALLPNETLEIQQELEPEQEPEPEQESEPAQVPEPVQEPEPAQEPESNQIKTYPNATTKTTQETDPALWHQLFQEAQSFWISNGPSMCQNNDGSFKNSERLSCGQKRYLSKSCFLELDGQHVQML